MAVFIFHINFNWLPGGFLGVDLFFVLSGYLITTITISDIDRGKFSFVNFFRKRVKRIAPAYYVLLFITTIFGVAFWMYTDLYRFFRTLKYCILFISNLFFAEGNSYFGANLTQNPFLHTWSLAIEMQFYLILPFIIFFFKKHLKIVFIILIIFLTSYSLYNTYYIDNKSVMYFSLLARGSEFLIGSLYSVLFIKKIDFGKTKNNLFAITSLIIFICCLFMISEKSHFPGAIVLIPCIAIANLLVIKENVISTFFSNKYFVKIGEYSYSLYLWHWPVMAFIRYNDDDYELSFTEISIVICITVFMSWLSFKFIESSAKWYSDKKIISIYCSLALVLVLFSFNYKHFLSFEVIPELYSKPYFGIESHMKNKVEKFGDLTKNDSILLIGDSHALMLKPFFDFLGKRNDFSIKTLTADSFVPIDGILNEEILYEKDHKYFEKFQQFVPTVSNLIDNSELIIINGISFDRISSYQTALEQLAKSLRSNQKLILINTFPTVNANQLRINRGFIKNSNYKIEKNENIKSKIILQDLASKYKNVYYYDISKSQIFKTPGYINDTVAYYDKAHINTFASLKLAQDLEADFMSFLNEIRQKQ